MSGPDPYAEKLPEDIYTSANRILDRLRGTTRKGFLGAGGMDLQDIVPRRLTIIGEAAAALIEKAS